MNTENKPNKLIHFLFYKYGEIIQLSIQDLNPPNVHMISTVLYNYLTLNGLLRVPTIDLRFSFDKEGFYGYWCDTSNSLVWEDVLKEDMPKELISAAMLMECGVDNGVSMS